MIDFTQLEHVFEKNSSELNDLFYSILENIEKILKVEPINNNIQISFINKRLESQFDSNFFALDINYNIERNKLTIEFYRNSKFLNFIMLREAYNCFIPVNLREIESVQIVVNQLLLNDLSFASNHSDWKSLFRKTLKTYDSISTGFSKMVEFNRIQSILNLERFGEVSLRLRRFFFYYIRNYSQLISPNLDIFNFLLSKKFLSLSLNLMRNDEIVETIRIITLFFYKYKNFHNLNEFMKYFRKLKENKEISTDLSQRKFSKFFSWLKNTSLIAPTYQLNWRAINIELISVFLTFNPSIQLPILFEFIKQLPFFISPKISRDGFSVEVFGYFVIPEIYLRDLKDFLVACEDLGYLIDKKVIILDKYYHISNLNNLKEFNIGKKLINPLLRESIEKNIIQFEINYSATVSEFKLNPLSFLILDRIRFFSSQGFGFENRRNIINIIKNDLINEIEKQNSFIKKFKDILIKFSKNSRLKNNFFRFLERNRKYSFFYIKNLLIQVNKYLEVIEKSDIKPTENLNIDLKLMNLEDYDLFERGSLLSNKFFKRFIKKEINPLSLESKEKLEKKREHLALYEEIFRLADNLKIFSTNSLQILINNKNNEIQRIYKTKKRKIDNSFNQEYIYNIKMKDIDKMIRDFLAYKPPIIKPILINTVINPDMENYFPQLILENTNSTKSILEELKKYFPRIIFYEGNDLYTNKDVIYVELSVKKLKPEYLRSFYSIIFNLFGKELIFMKPYYWGGLITAVSSKNFYDFENNTYFYTHDLFEELKKYMKNLFGRKKPDINIIENEREALLWSNEDDLNKFILDIEKSDSRKNINYKFENLSKILTLNQNLDRFILNSEYFRKISKKFFYQNYVDSIKVNPSYYQFGLSKYYYYLSPTDMNSIDFKLLLSNNFTNLKFNSSISKSKTFLIEYIFPYQNPNTSYLNWLTKSKKIIREYCIFHLKKLHYISHFNYNLTIEGWELDPNRFKSHIQLVLINKDYKYQIPSVKEFNLGKRDTSKIYGMNSREFKALTELYKRDSLDVKSILGTNRVNLIEKVKYLVKNRLVFPILKLKNIELDQPIFLILPDIERKNTREIIDIFSFFNLVYIYEIEGEFFISGFHEQRRFENGFMIKLYLPKTEIHEFLRIFDKLFNFLNVDHYVILTDLIDGDTLLKNIFNNVDNFEDYNPLKNLKWNNKDKIWMNSKLFDEHFNPIYPDLIKNETEEN
ncbi:MAG: hypothetical protein GF317_22685 [Candidatus Lokiarchaeota archaeon]|nr:hypothetical protein [Candidatus Lokiarchaeota archaeon]MBD3202273.1 hypothetical protein [Candidatus Lokiarchaeota archaeon]